MYIFIWQPMYCLLLNLQNATRTLIFTIVAVYYTVISPVNERLRFSLIIAGSS